MVQSLTCGCTLPGQGASLAGPRLVAALQSCRPACAPGDRLEQASRAGVPLFGKQLLAEGNFPLHQKAVLHSVPADLAAGSKEAAAGSK